MNVNRLIISVFIIIYCTSCNDFLDEQPDNRIEIDSREKIRQLLVSAYPSTDYSVLAEMSSDNICDLNGKTNPNTNRFLNKIAYWEDSNQLLYNDDATFIWQSCYQAISNANLALETITKIGEESLKAEKAEALMARAYAHFVLVNIFSKHYSSSSGSDLGVVYMDTPESALDPKYTRSSVSDIYERINQDIEAALPFISSNYDIKKYHFNIDAAYAFAARFNLYYEKWDKAVVYASKVLNSNQNLINWQGLSKLPLEHKVVANAYIVDHSCLLSLADISNAGLYFGDYPEGSRFSHTHQIAKRETILAPMPWGMPDINKSFKLPPLSIQKNDNFDKLLMLKIPYFFETTDPIQQIGYTRTVTVPFTVDETLLVRAEAYIHLNQYDNALADLNKWSLNFYNNDAQVTLSQIEEFYNNLPYSTVETPTQKKVLKPSFSITEGVQENMFHYLLQCRRVATLHEGLRWFDIKRYGIAVQRYVENKKDNSLIVVADLQSHDLRKAIQIPQDVILAGLQPNPR